MRCSGLMARIMRNHERERSRASEIRERRRFLEEFFPSFLCGILANRGILMEPGEIFSWEEEPGGIIRIGTDGYLEIRLSREEHQDMMRDSP